MKMNIKGLVFVGFAAAVFAGAANAASDKIVTSKTYVDTKYVGAEGGHITVTPNTTTGKNEISADVGVTGVDTHDGTHLSVVNGIVTLPAEQAVNDGTLSIKVGDNEAQTFTANTASNTNVDLGAAAGADLAAGITDDEQGLTSGDQVYNFVIDQVADGYVAGTNVQITDGTGENAGKKVVSATDTTYTADGTTVQLSNGQFSANTNGGVADGGNNLTTGGQVYDFVTGLMPATVPSSCTAQAPCALVFAGGTTPTWEPIQQ